MFAMAGRIYHFLKYTWDRMDQLTMS